MTALSSNNPLVFLLGLDHCYLFVALGMDHGHGYEKQVLHPPLSVLETEDHDFIALPFFSFFPAPGYIQSSLLIILSICYLSKKQTNKKKPVIVKLYGLTQNLPF